MDFVPTTDVPGTYLTKENPEKWEQYPFPDRVLLHDYDYTLESALFTHAGKKIEEFEGAQESLEKRMELYISVTMFALAAIPAILATVVFEQSELLITAWGPIALGLSTFAVLLTLVQTAWAPIRKKRSERLFREIALKRYVPIGFATLAGIVAFILAAQHLEGSSKEIMDAVRAAGLEDISAIIEAERSGKKYRQAECGRVDTGTATYSQPLKDSKRN